MGIFNSAKKDIKNTSNNGQVQSRHTMDDINDYANEAGRNLRKFADNAGDKLNESSKALADTVRKNPVRVGAIALGLGIAARLLLRRK